MRLNTILVQTYQGFNSQETNKPYPISLPKVSSVGEVVKYFSQNEFKCQCRYRCGKGFDYMDQHLIKRLDLARSIAKFPFVLISTIRCDQHNEDVGGIKFSAHTKGLAVDIKATTSHARFKILFGLIKAGFTRIGVYKTFIHADLDTSKPQEVIWHG